MAIDSSDPRTWEKIGSDPKLKHLAENANFYDGNIHEDLALLKACGIALGNEIPGVRLDLHVEDDGTMHVAVNGPNLRPTDVFVLEGRYLVYVAIGQSDERMAEANTPAEVVERIKSS